jgi:hypothetical protein
MGECGLDSSGWGWRAVAESGEHENELSGTIKREEFFVS